MANCQNCGTQLGNEKFSGGCGTPVPTAEQQPIQDAPAVTKTTPVAPVMVAQAASQPVQPDRGYQPQPDVTAPQQYQQPQQGYQQPQQGYQQPQQGYQQQVFRNTNATNAAGNPLTRRTHQSFARNVATPLTTAI